SDLTAADALHDRRDLRRRRPAACLPASGGARAWASGGPSLRRERGRRGPRALLPADGDRRPEALRGLGAALARARRARGRAGRELRRGGGSRGAPGLALGAPREPRHEDADLPLVAPVVGPTRPHGLRLRLGDAGDAEEQEEEERRHDEPDPAPRRREPDEREPPPRDPLEEVVRVAR